MRVAVGDLRDQVILEHYYVLLANPADAVATEQAARAVTRKSSAE